MFGTEFGATEDLKKRGSGLVALRYTIDKKNGKTLLKAQRTSSRKCYGAPA